MSSQTLLLKTPSAWIPIVLSLVALVLFIGALVLVGIPQQQPEDEGTLARVWQILIGTQALFVLYFAIVYLPKRTREALPIFIAQLLTALAACAPVFLLNL